MRGLIIILFLTLSVKAFAQVPTDRDTARIAVILLNSMDYLALEDNDSTLAISMKYDDDTVRLDISTLVGGGGGGADDQTLTLGSKIGVLQDISIENGNTISIPVDDIDNDTLNEIELLNCPDGQIMKKVSGTWQCADDSTADPGAGDGVVNSAGRSGSNIVLGRTNNLPNLSVSVNDGDPDANNEIQLLSRNGSTITLSNGGGSFTDNDVQTLGYDPVTGFLSISGGNSVGPISGGGGGGGGSWTGGNPVLTAVDGATVEIDNVINYVGTVPKITFNGAFGSQGEVLKVHANETEMEWGQLSYLSLADLPTLITDYNDLSNKPLVNNGTFWYTTGAMNDLVINGPTLEANYEFQVNGDAKVTGNIRLNGSLLDGDGQAGSAGQILSSTGSSTDWINAPSGGGTDDQQITEFQIVSDQLRITLEDGGGQKTANLSAYTDATIYTSDGALVGDNRDITLGDFDLNFDLSGAGDFNIFGVGAGNVDIDKAVSISGGATFTSNVTMSQAAGVAVQSIKYSPRSDPTTCDASTEGTFYYRSSDNTLRVCSNASGGYQYDALALGNIYSSNGTLGAARQVQLDNNNLYIQDLVGTNVTYSFVPNSTHQFHIDSDGDVGLQLDRNSNNKLNLEVSSTEANVFANNNPLLLTGDGNAEVELHDRRMRLPNFDASGGPPSGTNKEGDMYWDSDSNKIKVWDGSAWQTVTFD